MRHGAEIRSSVSQEEELYQESWNSFGTIVFHCICVVRVIKKFRVIDTMHQRNYLK